jgi:hypothetical protein
VRPDGCSDADWQRLETMYAEGRYETPDEETEPTSWVPVDLVGALDATDVEPPRFLKRSDGLCLLYPGRVHAFQGESESLKSWAAVLACRQVFEAGGNVLYVDFEDDARGVVSRLLALGVGREQILEHFIYIRPDEPLRTRHEEGTAGGEDLKRVLDARSFALAVVDGVTEAMTTEGLDLISNTDVATWMRRLPRRLARTGAAVAVIDHLPKDRTNQGRYSLGAQHKLAGLDGAAYKFTLLKYFARAFGSESIEGRAAITVEKDRPGYVRGHCGEDRVGTLSLMAYPDGGVTGSIDPPAEGEATDEKLVERILAYLTTYDGASKNAIETSVTGNVPAIRVALNWMTDPLQALVRVELKGCSHLHYLTDAGRSWPEPPGTSFEEGRG